jgi:hypothetical protein
MKNVYLSILDLTVKVFKLHDKKVVVSGSMSPLSTTPRLVSPSSLILYPLTCLIK